MRRPIKNKKQPTPDSKYNSVRVQKLIDYIMEDGKKEVAKKIVYGAFDQIKTKNNLDPLQTFESALQNVGPDIEVRSRRIGGANYQIPREVQANRRTALALRWIIQSAKNKKGSSMANRLSKEILSANNSEGDAFTKKENVHKMAEANKAFSHLSW